MPEALPALLIQSAAAAGLGAALVALWKVSDPRERLRVWLLALVLPPVLAPVFSSAAPFRSGPAFREHLALFDASRWRDLSFGSVRLDLLVVAAAAIAGAILFLRDLLPLLARREAGGPPAAADAVRLVRGRVATFAAFFGYAPPEVVVTSDDEAYLLCRGTSRPTVVVSEGAVRILTPGELDAALAHEVAHAAWGHVRLGWALMGARALVVWNPVAQVLGRTAVLELERAADDAAIAATGRAEDLASALAKLAGVTLGKDLPGTARRTPAHGRLGRLLSGGTGDALPSLGSLRLSLAGAAVALTAFFVV
jgi:Zn-dependent protease with chaperone function